MEVFSWKREAQVPGMGGGTSGSRYERRQVRIDGRVRVKTALRQPWGPFLESPEKPSLKLRPACSVKLVFAHDVMGRKIKITAKFRVLERLRFQDTKRIMSPEKFRDFRETGSCLL